MGKPDSRTVGKSEPITLPPVTVVMPGDTPQDGADNPTTRQSDNTKTKPRARLAAPLLLLAFVAVAAGGVLAVHEWGWWGLAAAAVCLAVVVVLAFSSWRRTAKNRRSTSTRRTSSRTGGPGRANRLGGRGGAGTSGRRLGILGRLAGRTGGTGRGRGGLMSRLGGRPGAGTRGRGGLFGGSSRRGRSASPGRPGGRPGSVLGRGGRGPRMGRGGALLSTGSGPNLGGRGSNLFGGRRGTSRRTAGIAKGWRSGGHMLAAPSMPSLGKAVKTADKAVGKAAGRGWFATANAVTEAINTVKPFPGTTGPHHQGDTVKSEFESITELIPISADKDPVTQHDLGIEAVIGGMLRGYEYIAQYVDKYRERIETENYAGTEQLTIETLDAVARATRACGPVIDESLKVLKLSPSWQDLQKRIETPQAARSDVSLAKRMGLA